MVNFKCESVIRAGLCQGDCCGIIPISKEVCSKFEHRQQRVVKEIIGWSDTELVPITEDGKCVFLNPDSFKCMIYDDRPLVCKEYGTRPDLPCPYLKPNGNIRSGASRNRVKRMIDKRIDYLVACLEKGAGGKKG